MNTQEVQTRIQSLKTIIDLIDGKEFNGMKLTKPGACAYVIDGKPNESCIVGCAMKPEVRKEIVTRDRNGASVDTLFREQILGDCDMLLQGITQQE
jgi:aerobic-type carbon monoxide dehydrogenase small subunit (CoxS/CutS family)